MATGDLSNNIRKLKAKLKAVKYTEEIDVNGLAEGTATVYLPVYHYAFTSYCPALTEQILGKDIELYGKSDARFMESVYKVLRDVFSYKPPISKEQFFNRGFAERKVIMCTEILQLVKNKATALNPPIKTSMRPKSVPVMTKQTSSGNLSKGRRPVSAKNENQSVKEISPRLAPQVVNELRSEPGSQPVRHVASHSMQKAGSGVRHVARHSTGDHHVSRHSSGDSVQNNPGRASFDKENTRPDLVRHVAIRSPPDEFRYQTEQISPEQQMKPTSMCLNTPSIARICPQSVEVVTMPKGLFSHLPDQSAIEINAPTSDSVLYGPVASSQDVQHQITSLYQALETLTGQLQKVDNSMKVIEQKVSGQSPDPYIQTLENKIQSQIENLMARMVLVENRLSLVETKLDTVNSTSSTVRSEVHNGYEAPAPKTNPASYPTSTVRSQVHNGYEAPSMKANSASYPTVLPEKSSQFEPIDEKGSSFATELKFLSTAPKIQSFMSESTDLSLQYSPIRRAGGTGPTGQLMSANEETFVQEQEDDARRSSTPAMSRTLVCTEKSSICCNISDGEMQDRVSRIKSMSAGIVLLEEKCFQQSNKFAGHVGKGLHLHSVGLIKETEGLLTDKQPTQNNS